MFGEILLFCFFTLRVMWNLGRDYEGANSLAAILSGAFKPLPLLTNNDYPNVAKLMEYQGSPGEEIIFANLTYGQDIIFELKPEVFDVFGKGIEYYAISSVLILLKYLVKKREGNEIYRNAIYKAALECSRIYYSERLTGDNLVWNALLITNSSFKKIRENQLANGSVKTEESNEDSTVDEHFGSLLKSAPPSPSRKVLRDYKCSGLGGWLILMVFYVFFTGLACFFLLFNK
ncbi:MAG: hypothetical protein QHH10_09070 [Peptococcaceae bacterium]|nr:hypothetical protein [Peptococcaceae bacterium]MDH7525447.1 hypothetical protein [Peptococcaceae bacterium]